MKPEKFSQTTYAKIGLSLVVTFGLVLPAVSLLTCLVCRKPLFTEGFGILFFMAFWSAFCTLVIYAIWESKNGED